MTDSMKFGPEWLRNLSTDSTTNPSIGNSVVSGSGNSSANVNSVLSTAGYNYHGNSTTNVHLTGHQRNMFPQFRYGREELLSLFDKKCNLPEIFPGNKKLFVDKIQVPLALTPNTDEEVFSQVAAPLVQRPVWMRRSPVGFPPTPRGSGRGSSSVDRGRMRGKSVYHPIYQRPNTMFDTDDIRPSVKAERSWVERNGAGDLPVTGNGTYVGAGVSNDWNGTQTSSQRKDFSSHSRNMENWRKNRAEDGSGDANASVIIGTDGWRGGPSNYTSTHRWVRSTSWRDEDTVTATSADVYGANGIPMQRSYSAICTAVTERVSSASKNSSVTSVTGNVGSNHIILRQAGKSSTAIGTGRNQWTTGSSDPADDLPEWAMENPSDSGGTFDASGAFHGSVDDEVLIESKDYECPSKHINIASNDDCSSSTAKVITKENDMIQQNQETEDKEILCTEKYVVSPVKGNDDSSNSGDTNVENSVNDDQRYKPQNAIHQEELHNLQYETRNESPSAPIDSKMAESSPQPSIAVAEGAAHATASASATDISFLIKQTARLHMQATNSHSDLSDRMQEVADDMVEKLIMDDDPVGSGNINASKSTKSARVTSATGNMSMPDSFISPVAAIMKQAAHQQISPNLIAASALPALAANQKVMPLYDGGLVVDHDTIQQQLAAASGAVSLDATMNSAANVDLWYYRDPQSKVQGPFNAMEMTEWYRAGYFDENLFVRRVCDTRFRALGELIKLCHGNMPFTHTHLIPMGLDSVITGSNNETTIRHVRDKQQQGINDFGLKLQLHQDRREDLKANVTAAADSLSAAVKSLILPVDMSHMLNMHFQMLQEQYLRHQEVMIMAEYSTKEGFQNLTPTEKDAVVHQKMQMLGLPEYLTSLAGLTNTLTSLNPSAANQLYDLIAECSKKNQHFASPTPRQQEQQQDQQQQVIANLFLDRDDFGLNVQKRQQSKPFSEVSYCENSSSNAAPGGNDISSTDLIIDFDLRMLLLNNNMNAQQAKNAQPAKTPTADYEALSSSNNMLSQQQLISAASQSPVLQMWMPELTVANTVQPLEFLSRHLSNQETTNQWTGNPLVSLPNTDMSRPVSMACMETAKATPASMWDVLPLERVPSQFHSNVSNFDVQPQAQERSVQTPRLKESKDEQNQNNALLEADNISDKSLKVVTENTQQEKTVSTTKAIPPCKLHKEDQSDKLQQPSSIIKRASNKLQVAQFTKKEGKQENLTTKKQTEEDRRREIIEDRRRQKEEKRRQQAEEEKRRLQQIEEEKLQQQLEEKERQQQIQTQRRKAMLGSATPNVIPKTSKDQRVQSSVAPWSLQNNAVVCNSGPSLVEIQKAERRERRADQQRQMEILEKQMRANTAAAAESNDAFLKWNSAPMPVSNFAEIQAEEAKRLVAEQLENQRRKEQEQSVALCANIVSAGGKTVGSSVSSNSISTIWSGSKVWGSNSNAGFWEDPVKFNEAVVTNNSLAMSASGAGTGTKLQQLVPQQKFQVANNPTVSSNRNLMKTQTLPTVQNTLSSNSRNVVNAPTDLKQGTKQQQKSNISANTEKKSGTARSNNSHTSNSSGSNSSNRSDEYQNEFTDWCIKSLSRMITKVDVPTFVTFLQDLESPYEVKDYVRMYLGDSKEYTEFAKQFLERRSKYKNLQREQNAHNDDMCKPAPAITPLGNDSMDNKAKQKKIKKSKMTKVDARILGFSVTAAEGRINVGDRDYVDGP